MSRRRHSTTAYVESRRAGPAVYLDYFAVDDTGRGHGRAAYERWERALSADVERVVLDSMTESLGFWLKMGYQYLYRQPDDPDFIVPDVMVKGVNGHPTPEQVEWEGGDYE